MEIVMMGHSKSHWNVTFSRSLNDWEKDGIYNFLAALAKMNILPEGLDKIVWPYDLKVLSPSRVSIKSFMMVEMVPIFLFLPFGSLEHLWKHSFVLGSY